MTSLNASFAPEMCLDIEIPEDPSYLEDYLMLPDKLPAGLRDGLLRAQNRIHTFLGHLDVWQDQLESLDHASDLRSCLVGKISLLKRTLVKENAEQKILFKDVRRWIRGHSSLKKKRKSKPPEKKDDWVHTEGDSEPLAGGSYLGHFSETPEEWKRLVDPKAGDGEPATSPLEQWHHPETSDQAHFLSLLGLVGAHGCIEAIKDQMSQNIPCLPPLPQRSRRANPRRKLAYYPPSLGSTSSYNLRRRSINKKS